MRFITKRIILKRVGNAQMLCTKAASYVEAAEAELKLIRTLMKGDIDGTYNAKEKSRKLFDRH